MREIALDKRLVPGLRMADIADREVEMLRPEERDHRKGLVSAQHVCGRDLALALSDSPMFYANAFASMGIGPAGNVACGENVEIAGLQPRIDQNSIRAPPCKTTCLSSIRATLAPR